MYKALKVKLEYLVSSEIKTVNKTGVYQCSMKINCLSHLHLAFHSLREF